MPRKRKAQERHRNGEGQLGALETIAFTPCAGHCLRRKQLSVVPTTYPSYRSVLDTHAIPVSGETTLAKTRPAAGGDRLLQPAETK